MFLGQEEQGAQVTFLSGLGVVCLLLLTSTEQKAVT